MSTTFPEPKTTSVGHLIVAQLERAGVERVYAVPGESYLDVLDGLHDSSITTVVARHEGGAGFMALAEGRLSEVPGVAMVTRGPGAANAFIAVHTAYQDATPLVLFVGLIPRADRGRESFQEFDLTGWFGSTAKKVITLDHAETAAEVVADALHTAAAGRPGPVVVGLPEDLLVEPVSSQAVPPRTVAAPGPSPDDLAELTQRLREAQRPLLVVGGEGWDQSSGEALVRWAASAGVPVAADFRAYDAVPHILEGGNSYIGSLGYGRSDELAARYDAADLLIFVGCARTDVLSDGYTKGLQAETVLVLPGDPLGHFGRIDQHIVAGVREFARALGIVPASTSADPAWLIEGRQAYLAYTSPRPDGGAGADMGLCMEVLQRELNDDAVITYGAGNHALWAARYLQHTTADSLAAPRNGAMGMGVPAAVAAALRFPGRQVLAVEGDGDFGMNGQEFATAVGYDCPIIVLVVDNQCFATIREHQELHYPERPSGTHLTNPDYAQWARAHGGHGERVERTEDFEEAFRRAAASGRPSIIHLLQDPRTRSPRTASD
ncbi:thiamine pyrophosphate-dependent enzyme [Nesterenkonia flava]|uniref:Thiamine pyrophosphate-binding protein n=1 Tax=Nesterenkonia flava TaxID=469799 RepID=A0ABU1FV80_9MICC|nr:thiamine pyrophosphate-dependent enzyme [Nesterenkonia flava]MDR5712247.1 thiamine pyrophosphate-binding protein [Nesterenkonia flava]